MTRPQSAAATAACLAIMSLAGACSGDRASSSAPDRSSSDAMRSFAVDEANVSFNLPSGWEEFDREKAQEALSDSTVMKDLTDRIGLTRDQFEQMMASNIVLYATAPQAVEGFLDNVNVIVSDERLPSEGTTELQYRGLGATDVRSEDVTTDVGDGYATTYTLDVGGIEVHGEVIALEVDDRAVAITVSTNDSGETAQIVSDLRQSLAPTE